MPDSMHNESKQPEEQGQLAGQNGAPQPTEPSPAAYGPHARRNAAVIIVVVVAIAAMLIGGKYLAQRGERSGTISAGGPKPGTAAPDFALQSLEGKTVHLSDFRGKAVLLNFWATWCDPCRQEIPRFVELQNKYGERGLQVVGVSLDDDAKAVPPFYRQYKMNYPVAVGDAKLAERFGDILGLPVNLLIDRDGRIAARHVGEANIPQVETEIRSLLQTPQAPQGGG